MSDAEEIGNVMKKHDGAEFEWKINDFFSVAENKTVMKSPPFYFVDSTWCFRLYFKSQSEFAIHLVEKMGHLDCSVEYHFGLKKLDSTVEHLTKGNLSVKSDTLVLTNGISCRFSNIAFFELSDVQQRKSELAPSDVLTVTCTLKCENTHSKRANLLMPLKPQKFTSK